MNNGLTIALGNLLIFGASLQRKRHKYWLKIPPDFVHRLQNFTALHLIFPSSPTCRRSVQLQHF
ncbi:hypothetical protein T10_1006 [Trichinella papuae]|uniref:Uncharacterized protein n=1 Tax=Trichinella papuae TaxID=268474 RepID=A0A0V1LYT4_9BILA|nr:hypothetical protein T10_1006 [Trichinella papuae]